MNTRIRFATWAISGLCLCASVSSAHSAQPDAWITTKVKIALISSSGVDGFPVSVDTYDGHVTLFGKVSTVGERDEAARLAGEVHGVQDVRNLIQVVPSERVRFVNAADARVKHNVSRALEADPDLHDSRIEAKSVNRGVVLLSGNASSLSDHLRALQDASDVAGVRRVESEVRSPDQFGDRDIWYDEPGTDSRGGSRVQDAWITARTKLRFFADARIPSSDISVDTHQRVVTIFGTAPNEAVRGHAERLARSEHGVRDVRNELRIVPRSQHEDATASDGAITETINRRLVDADLNGARIHVDVKAGVARLSGSVQRAMDRYSAMAIARSTDGVHSVQDDLRIESQRTSIR